jgi:hypothetical protein
MLALASLDGGYETVGEAADAKAYPMPGRLIDVGGHRLHLSCTGLGTPTVVLEPAAAECRRISGGSRRWRLGGSSDRWASRGGGMAGYEVSDELWARIQPLLPVKPRRSRWPGRRPLDHRACLNGILFVLLTGIRWTDLPQQLGYGSGMTCWRRLRDWRLGPAPRATAGPAARCRPDRLVQGRR